MNIARLLHASARSFAGQPTVFFGDRPVHRYSGLLARAVALGGALRALSGINPGDCIAMAMKNCPQYIEPRWACWHAGLCIVPVNANLRSREIAYILDNCGVKYCFCTDDVAATLAPLVGEMLDLEQVFDVDGAEYERLAIYDSILLQLVPDEQPDCLYCTSGTTGKPKGVTLTHRSLLAKMLHNYADVDQFATRESMIHATPLSHATGLYAIPHIAKGPHHIIPASQGFDVGEMFERLDLYCEAIFFTAPTMLSRMANEPCSAKARVASIKALFTAARRCI